MKWLGGRRTRGGGSPYDLVGSDEGKLSKTCFGYSNATEVSQKTMQQEVGT